MALRQPTWLKQAFTGQVWAIPGSVMTGGAPGLSLVLLRGTSLAMRGADDEVTWAGDFVHVTRNGIRVASGRWRQGRIIERSGILDQRDDAAAWHALEDALRAESDAFVESSAAAAYDARGVDLTQIRRMLSLSPAERLEVLDRERYSIACLLENATGN